MVKKYLVLLFLLCFCSSVYAAGEVEFCVYVDPSAVGDNDGGRDGATDANDPSQEGNWTDAYISLSAMDADAASCGGLGSNNLTTEWTTGVWLHVYCRNGDGSSPDTTAAVLNGFTQDADSYIQIEGYDFPADGIYDATKYVLAKTAGFALEGDQNYLRLVKLQFESTIGSGANGGCIILNTLDAGNDIRIDSCIFKGVIHADSTISYGVTVNDTDAIVTIINSIFFDWDDVGTSYAIYASNQTTTDIYNTVIFACDRGVYRASSGEVTVVNSVICNGTDASNFIGTNITVSYTASDENPAGTANIDWAGNDAKWAAAFTNAGANDFSLLVGGECVDTGNGAAAKAISTVDITDVDRSGVADLDWDIGAYEYVAASGDPGGQGSDSGGIKYGFKNGGGKDGRKQN